MDVEKLMDEDADEMILETDVDGDVKHCKVEQIMGEVRSSQRQRDR